MTRLSGSALSAALLLTCTSFRAILTARIPIGLRGKTHDSSLFWGQALPSR